MNTFILIMFAATHNGLSQHSIEFSTKAACLDAKAVVYNEIDPKVSKFTAQCVAKYKP